MVLIGLLSTQTLTVTVVGRMIRSGHLLPTDLRTRLRA
jgi:hypothetical protein